MTQLAEHLRGAFLVLDGPDGAGKTTQSERLTAWIEQAGLEVVRARDPGGTAIGDRVRTILLDNAHGEMAVECELMLYMASRAQLAAEVIRPAVARGACVVCDRWVSSTIAYQGAGGVPPQTVQAVAEVAVAGVQPRLTLLLDLPAAEGLLRGGARSAPDRMESKDMDFHRRVRQAFLDQAAREPDRFTVLDAAGTVEEVQRQIRETLAERLGDGGA